MAEYVTNSSVPWSVPGRAMRFVCCTAPPPTSSRFRRETQYGGCCPDSGWRWCPGRRRRAWDRPTDRPPAPWRGPGASGSTAARVPLRRPRFHRGPGFRSRSPGSTAAVGAGRRLELRQMPPPAGLMATIRRFARWIGHHCEATTHESGRFAGRGDSIAVSDRPQGVSAATSVTTGPPRRRPGASGRRRVICLAGWLPRSLHLPAGPTTFIVTHSGSATSSNTKSGGPTGSAEGPKTACPGSIEASPCTPGPVPASRTVPATPRPPPEPLPSRSRPP